MTFTAQPLAQELWTAPRHGLWELLCDELTLAPERTARMVRMSILAMGVVLISMALRVPEAAVSAYMVFFVTRDDAPSSVKSGIGLIVAVILAVLLGLVVLCFTDGEPGLRLAAVAAMAFGAMYAARRSTKLGPLGFGVGFVVTMLLVYVDLFQSSEVLPRAACWLGVAVAYPAALVVLCESTFGANPEVLLRRGLSARFLAVAALLEATPEEAGRARRRVERLERLGTAGLAPYAARGPAALVPVRTSLVGEVQTLVVMASQVPSLPAGSSLRGSLRQAGADCRHLSRAILGEKGIELEPPPAPGSQEVVEGDAASLAVVLPLLASVRGLGLGIKHLRRAAPATVSPPTAAVPPGAAELEEQRTEALHFAAKVTLAAMGAYILYTALDWRGIHTVMITCFFVAQESVGATIHKFTLRIIGATIGGALGILSLILVLPRLDSGGGLAVLVGVVTLLAAWIGSGSQRISYAGWQIAFAFYLTVLHGGFSRTTKMVVARDRALGVLLGNVLISIVFIYLWPVRVGPRIADGIARALDALADLISVESAGPESETRSAQLEQAFFAGLSKAEESAFVARFEPEGAVGASMLPALSSLFIPARALSLSAPGEGEQALPEAERWRVEAVATLRRELARQLHERADAVRERRAPKPQDGRNAFDGPLRSFAAVSDATVRKALAPLKLRLEWLAMIRRRLDALVPPATVAVQGAGR